MDLCRFLMDEGIPCRELTDLSIRLDVIVLKPGHGLDVRRQMRAVLSRYRNRKTGKTLPKYRAGAWYLLKIQDALDELDAVWDKNR